MMTPRERFVATLRFEPVDRPWRLETIGFWRETIHRWHNEGLPRFVFNEIAAMPWFKFDPWITVYIGAAEDPGMFPPFAPKVIERDGETEIVRDFSGKTYRRFRDRSASIPQHVGSPVSNMDDFRAIRWRLDPNFPGRCDNPVWNGAAALAERYDAPFNVHVSGLFAFHRHLMGVEKLMYAYYDQPELIHAMSRQWVRLCAGVIRRFARKTQITAVNFWEDMCFKNGPIISPKIFTKFLTPYYRQVTDTARECGAEGLMVDTDGDCTLLIPLFIDVGINFLYPFEVQAGMDIRKVREQWGNKLAIMGGIDKRVLERTEEEIEAEVEAKVPALLRSGGYIPSLDHAVHPDVPLKNFKFYMRLLRRKYSKT